MKKFYGFWVLFESRERRILKQIIKQLSNKKLDGSIFEPHLSVHSTVFSNIRSIKEKITREFKNVKKFSVETNGYGFEDTFSKTLFINIKANQQLLSINQKLLNLFSEEVLEEKEYQPHISLIYKLGMNEKEKQNLIKNIQIPNVLHARSIGIVDPGVNANNWNYYSEWSIPFELEFENS